MIGIYGGSFDPVHLGHLNTAKSIKKELNFERLFLLPCFEPVHKNSLHYSSTQRLEMLDLAIKKYPSLEIDTREIDRGGNSFMIDTLAELIKEFKGKTICLIIGMDSFINFKTWKKWEIWDKGYERSMLRAFAGRELKNYIHIANVYLGLGFEYGPKRIVCILERSIKSNMILKSNYSNKFKLTIA